MANVLYLVAVYWPFLAAVFGIGLIVGWWVEARRDPADVSGWLDGGSDQP